MLALVGARHIVHVSRIRVNSNNCMLYILALYTITFAVLVKQTRLNFNGCVLKVIEPGQFSRYSDSLQAGGSGDRIPGEWAIFPVPVHDIPGE